MKTKARKIAALLLIGSALMASVTACSSKEEKKDDGCGGVSDSLPRYTQSLSAIEKGYSLDDAFNRLKGRR